MGDAPAPKPTKKSPPDAAIGPDRVFRLSHPIRFRGATARLAPDAEPILDTVARVIRENPEIRRVQILAHWDETLAADAAAKLTREQAEAVRDALVKRGVDGERLVARGVGSEKPAAPTNAAGSRGGNRRIELVAE